jgi:hypothetical protein
MTNVSLTGVELARQEGELEMFRDAQLRVRTPQLSHDTGGYACMATVIKLAPPKATYSRSTPDTRFAFHPALFGFLALAFTGSRLTAHSERLEQFFRCRGDGVHTVRKRSLIGFRWRLDAAHFAHVLKRSFMDFVFGRRGLEMVQDTNIAAHGCEDTRRRAHAPVRGKSPTNTLYFAALARFFNV